MPDRALDDTDTSQRSILPHALRGLLLIPLAVLAGCDGRLKTFPAGGTVHMEDGKPLSGGRVVFRSTEHGLAAKAVIGEDGSFVLGTHEKGDGAVAGAHTVGVTSPIDNPDAGYAVPIMPKYMRGSTSGLEFTVTEEGPNDFDITIEYAAARRPLTE